MHLKPVIETGRLFPVFSYEQLRRTLRELVQTPDLRSTERKQALEAECGPVDGRAVELIASALAAILERGPRNTLNTPKWGTMSQQ